MRIGPDLHLESRVRPVHKSRLYSEKASAADFVHMSSGKRALMAPSRETCTEKAPRKCIDVHKRDLCMGHTWESTQATHGNLHGTHMGLCTGLTWDSHENLHGPHLRICMGLTWNSTWDPTRDSRCRAGHMVQRPAGSRFTSRCISNSCDLLFRRPSEKSRGLRMLFS